MEAAAQQRRKGRLEDLPSLQGDGKMGDRVATEIAQRIVWGELEPGYELPTEREIAEAFGVSRTVVRDGIRTLSTLGLLSVKQGSGTTVDAPSAATFGRALLILLMRSGLTMEDVVDARAAIEIQLAPLAATRGTPADWNRLQAHLDAFAGAVEAEMWDRAEEHHLRFHGGMIRALHLPALELMLEPLHQVILLSSMPPRRDDPALWEVWAHPPILQQLRGRNPDAVRQAMREHFAAQDAPGYTELRSAQVRESPAARALFERLIDGQLAATPSDS